MDYEKNNKWFLSWKQDDKKKYDKKMIDDMKKKTEPSRWGAQKNQ